MDLTGSLRRDDDIAHSIHGAIIKHAVRTFKRKPSFWWQCKTRLSLHERLRERQLEYRPCKRTSF